jgi:hypothetical protein
VPGKSNNKNAGAPNDEGAIGSDPEAIIFLDDQEFGNF